MNITIKIFIIYLMGGRGIQINIEKIKKYQMRRLLAMGAARIVFSHAGCTTYWGVPTGLYWGKYMGMGVRGLCTYWV